MSAEGAFQFDFECNEDERNALLAEARKTVGALSDTLDSRSAGEPTTRTASEQAALDLLDQFDRAVAEFSAFPDVIRLEEVHFSEHGLPVPQRFRDLSAAHRFYWIRFPVVLKPAPGTQFYKLQCGVHFNPAVKEAHLLPRTAMIMPNRKFQEMLNANLGLDVRIGEDFEFEAGTGKLEAKAGPGALEARASVDAKLAAHAGLVAGPFTYSWKRAVVDHTAPGAEKVFWTLADSEFAANDELAFIVVLQVPADVKTVEISGALRAYHRFELTSDLGDALRYFGRRLRDFFGAGAPTTAPPTVWDITARL